jgi:hypothetical protein
MPEFKTCPVALERVAATVPDLDDHVRSPTSPVPS